MRLLAVLVASYIYLGLVAAAPLYAVESQKRGPAAFASHEKQKRDAVAETTEKSSSVVRFVSTPRSQFLHKYENELEQVLMGKGKAAPAEAQARVVPSGHSNIHNNEEDPSTALSRANSHLEVLLESLRVSSTDVSRPADRRIGLNDGTDTSSFRLQSGPPAAFPSIMTRTALSGPQSAAEKAVDTKPIAETAAKSKVGYLRDPKNAPKIIGASAVSVVATYLLGHQIKSNVETTQQLNENAARISAQQQEEAARALAQPVLSVGNIPATAPLGRTPASKEQEGRLRIQKRKQSESAIAVAKRGTPNPAGVFVAGVLGYAFYRGASEIEKQRARDRYLLMREQSYRNGDSTAQTSTTDEPRWKALVPL